MTALCKIDHINRNSCRRDRASINLVRPAAPSPAAISRPIAGVLTSLTRPELRHRDVFRSRCCADGKRRRALARTLPKSASAAAPPGSYRTPAADISIRKTSDPSRPITPTDRPNRRWHRCHRSLSPRRRPLGNLVPTKIRMSTRFHQAGRS
jgi:hypothetical protein